MVTHERVEKPWRTSTDGMRISLPDVSTDWQVLVRRPDGRAEQRIITRKRRVLLWVGALTLALWAGISTVLMGYYLAVASGQGQEIDRLASIVHQTTHTSTAQIDELQQKLSASLTESEQKFATTLAESEQKLAATHAESERQIAILREIERQSSAYYEEKLATSEKFIASLADDMENVRSNVLALAWASGELGSENNTNGPPLPPPEEATQRVEEALERLRASYLKALQQTSAAAAFRVDRTRKQLSQLGLDSARLIPRVVVGKGGPFIPAPPAALERLSLDGLKEQVHLWGTLRSVAQKLPLGVPFHGSYELSSNFGARSDPFLSRAAFHEGLDFGAPTGTPVYATGNGIVTRAGPWERYGNIVEIDHGNAISTRYAHLSQVKVVEKQVVTPSTLIGLVGSTGRSTGAHLHYEVRIGDVARDPSKFISVGRDVPKTR